MTLRKLRRRILKGDQEAVKKLLGRFEGLTRKYVRKYFSRFEEKDDFKQIIETAIWLGVKKRGTSDEILSSIILRIKNEIHKTVMFNVAEKRAWMEVPIEKCPTVVCKSFEDSVVLRLDLFRIRELLRDKQSKKVFNYLLNGFDRKEIAKLCRVSRARIGWIINTKINPVVRFYFKPFSAKQLLQEA